MTASCGARVCTADFTHGAHRHDDGVLVLTGGPRPEGSVDRLHGSGPEPFEACPDGGRCWHVCPLVEGAPEGKGSPCWRVSSAVPLSGVFPDDRWPDDVKAAHTR